MSSNFSKRANISPSQKRTVFISRWIALLIRRPPLSCMPRQFLNDVSTSLYVVIVLSQFCTFTVCRAISITSPSAPKAGASIQSPNLTSRLEAMVKLATRDRMVSRKTRMITAISAPMPDNNTHGDLPVSTAMVINVPTTYRKILAIWA